ncbi:zf-HC2 domain-containing protein [Streptomyces sp. AM6-12]|uniref:zf-HC2 domain-containing protein n=1 Tax=Streptomyces sp. AM6-12 TaxID=3345149 RepID=UPI0037B36C52
MSGSRQKPAEAHLAEQHLGDRLSALVDGELGHDTRERVLAHLATCARCKAEADAQRALKSVFATAAPPPPSASLLARLQGLPGGDGEPGGLLGPGPEPRTPGDGDAFGMRRGFSFGYVPARAQAPGPERSGFHREPRLGGENGFGAPGGPLGEDGFRIHPVGRADDGRSASRGLRFAFAAAGAVSLAAVALGGVTTAIPGYPAADARGTGSNVIPARTTGTGGAGATTSADAQRRRQGPQAAQGGGAPLGRTTPPPSAVAAPLVPGAPDTAAGQIQGTGGRAVGPLMAGINAVTPLIRPLDKAMDLPLSKWSTAPMIPGMVTGTGPQPAPRDPLRSAASAAPLASPLAAPVTPGPTP